MSRIGDWASEHPMWVCFGIVLIVVAGTCWLAVAAEAAIPLCEACGQKQYHHEVAYYMTTFIMVDKVMVPTQTPIYKQVWHACTGKRN